MAKISKACQFTKAVLTKEDGGRWTITEYIKDAVNTYDLEAVLNAFRDRDIDNLTITFRQESGIAPEPVEE